MPEDVKPRRYDSTRRQAQAAQTRKDILTAAHQVFLERGYTGATIASIAQAADVPSQAAPPARRSPSSSAQPSRP